MKECYILLRAGNNARKVKVKSYKTIKYQELTFHLVHIIKSWYYVEEKTGMMACKRFYNTRKEAESNIDDNLDALFRFLHAKPEYYKGMQKMLENAEEVDYDTLRQIRK